jgi:hypothetical protein
MNQLKNMKRRQACLKALKMDKFPKTWEETSPKEVDKMSKELFAILDVFQMFMVQQRETTTHNNKTTKLIG